MHSTRLLVLAGGVLLSGSALAGTGVFALDKDLEVAVQKANQKAAEAGRAHGTCMAAFANAKQCEKVQEGYWQCTAAYANHKKSCTSTNTWQDALTGASEALKVMCGQGKATACMEPPKPK